MTRLPAAALAALFVTLVNTQARAESEARGWLQRMSGAAHSLNYVGTFVYQHRGNLEAMHIVHAMDEDGERERLMSLTGPQREVLRDNEVVTCILADSQSVVVNKSRPRNPFPASLPQELTELERNYRFEVKGSDRVAGLRCRVVAVQPRDAFRYGRELCIHEDTYLLLRSAVTGPRGAIEQIMFTSVEFPERIAEDDLLPGLGGAGYTLKREPDQQPEAGDHATGELRWVVQQVPDGFMLTDHNWHQLSADEPGVEHWVYSDGLASVSVYIEKSQKEKDAYSGMTHRGALNAWGTMVAGHYVTVVGEVPRRTVELIGRSVRTR
jgi:sigma-E factor negative regulatory protein RseB